MLALLGLTVICAIGIFGYVTQSGVKNSRAWVLRTYDVRSELQNLETQLAEARANALAYGASGDEDQLNDFRTHSDNIKRVLQNLRQLTSDNQSQQNRLDEMETLSRKYLSEIESIVTLSAPRASQNSAKANAVRSLELRESEQRGLVRAMADDEQMLLNGRFEHLGSFLSAQYSHIRDDVGRYRPVPGFQIQVVDRGNFQDARVLEHVQRENARSARALSSRVLELQDSERRKVARELHDSVGQYLVGLKINLEQLLTTNPSLSPGHVKLLSDTIELTECCRNP